MSNNIATLGGGCFWCLEAVYEELNGVVSVVSGYAGGHTTNPTYEQVCSETTGHAEVIQITFKSDIVTFDDILDVFFTIHDPTTLNRQGGDVGTSYRSIILTHTPEQEATANQTIAQLDNEGLWDAPIVTQVSELDVFYPAEEYHQHYFKRNPGNGYCQVVVAPKVAKFRKKYFARLKA